MMRFAKHEPAMDPRAEMAALETEAIERGLEAGLTGIGPESFTAWVSEKVSALSHGCYPAPPTSAAVIDDEIARREQSIAETELRAREAHAPVAGTPSAWVMGLWLSVIGVTTLLTGLLIERSRGPFDVSDWLLVASAGALLTLLVLLAMLNQHHPGRAVAAWSAWRATAPLRRQLHAPAAERVRIMRSEGARDEWANRSHRLLQAVYELHYQRGLRARELQGSSWLDDPPAELSGLQARHHANDSAERAATPTFNGRE